MLYSVVSGQWTGGSDSVVKDRERHCLLIALIVRREEVISRS
jgi:hypothetical protein